MSCAGKINTSEEPSNFASAAVGPRTGRQDRQIPQQSSRPVHGVAVSPPSTEQHAPASSTDPFQVETVRRVRASIQNRQQVNPTALAGPGPGRLATARRKDCAQASSGGSAADSSQDGRSPVSRRKVRWHPSSNDPSPDTSQTSPSAVGLRRNFLHPSSDVSAAEILCSMRPRSDRRTTSTKSFSQYFQPGLDQEQRIIQSPTDIEGSIPSDRSQQRSANSLSQYASWPGQTIPSGTGKSTNGDGATSSKASPQDDSVAATGALFTPPPFIGQIALPGFHGKIGIGIEVEFLLKALKPENRRSTLDEFTDAIARKHNISVGNHHPQMKNEVFNFLTRTRFDKWALITDASMSTHREPCGYPSFATSLTQ